MKSFFRRSSIRAALLACFAAGVLAGVTYYILVPRVAVYEFNESRDTPYILDIFKQNWYWLVSSSTFSPEYMLKYRASSQDPEHVGNLFIKVLYKGKEPLGFVAYYKKKFYVGFILFLAVRQELRSKGYGRILLEHAINDLKKQGCTVIRLVTRTDNYPAQALYKRMGFQETGRDDEFVNFQKVL